MSNISILSLKKQYAEDVARLHIHGISTGFISSLGKGFVTALYEAITEDKNSFGFVAIEDGRVLGFIAFSSDLYRLYKYVVLKKGFKFAFILARGMLSFKVLKKIWDNILYPSKMKKMHLPRAELLSIVTANEGRGQGIAKQLVDAGFKECGKRNIDRVKVLVAANNESANKLYQKCSFELFTQINSHGFLSNIYVKDFLKKDNCE